MKFTATIITLVLLLASPITLAAKQSSTTQRNLRPKMEMLREVRQINEPADTVAEQPCDFDASAITIRGFVKRAGDEQESFVVENHSKYHITGLKLRLKYYSANGATIADRTIEVKCDIMPGKSQRVKVTSFDRNHAYHSPSECRRWEGRRREALKLYPISVNSSFFSSYIFEKRNNLEAQPPPVGAEGRLPARPSRGGKIPISCRRPTTAGGQSYRFSFRKA